MDNLERCAICQDSDPKLILFDMPKNPKMRKEWEYGLLGLKLTDSSKVCIKHFTQHHLSRNFLELTSNAIPTLYLKENLTNETDFKTEVEEFQFVSQDEFNDTSNIESEIAELKESRTCAYISATQNFMVYVINCLYCDTTFPIKNWDSFIRHVRDNHKFEDNAMELDSPTLDILNENSYTIEKSTTALNVTEEAEFNSEIVLSNPKTKDLISCDETDPITMQEKKVNSSENVKACKPVPEKLHKITTILTRNYDTSSSLATDGCAKYCNYRKKQINKKAKASLYPEISINTTDPKYVFSFIDMLRSYFRLWYAPKIKQADREKTFSDFYYKFVEKHEYEIKRSNLFKSVQNIREWYQTMFENEKFKLLVYPQSEYYRKCAEFLPDKLDGKICEICKRILPDNLQHFAHKHLEHPEAIANEHDPTNLYINGVPKSKIDDYIRARYPKTEPSIFECQICCKTIDSRWHFIFHIKSHIDVYRKDIREYVCDLCGAAFVQRVHFLTHRRRHTGPIKRKCLICGKEFNDFTQLTNHRKRYHMPIEGTIEDIEKSYKIRRGRTNTGIFRSQIDPETNQKFYSCTFCAKKYLYGPGLSKHVNFSHKKEYEHLKTRLQKSVTKVLNDIKVNE